MDIYENPSKYYTLVDYNGTIQNELVTHSTKHSFSAFGYHLLYQNYVPENKSPSNAGYFDGDGMCFFLVKQAFYCYSNP